MNIQWNKIEFHCVTEEIDTLDTAVGVHMVMPIFLHSDEEH